MSKYTNEFKLKIVREIIDGKGYTTIEREHGVLRGTAFTWVKKIKEGRTLENYGGNHNKKNYDEFEFLKKSFALLREIRSK